MDLTVNEKPEPKDEVIKSYESKFTTMNAQLSEEKSRNYKLSNHVKNLELTISKLKEEYELVVKSIDKKEHSNEDYDRVISS